jgi:membrane peptidoglycan carboxypeptidase
MPIASQIIKFRQRRFSRESHSIGLKLGLISGILISLAVVMLIFMGANVFFDLSQDLTSVDTLPSLLEPPDGALLQPTRFYDRTHQHVILTLENPAAKNKQYIRLSMTNGKITNQAFKYLADATIAAFDPNFWEESSNPLGVFSKGTQPFLAQKLVNNLRLVYSLPSQKRELSQRLSALLLTGKYGRLQILEWYLNTAHYGKLIFGADAAALAYFAKPAEELSLGEAVMLVSFEQNPSLDPFKDDLRLREMQVQVIINMLEQGFISSDQAQEALKENIQFQPQLEPESLSPEFTNLVLQQMSEVVPLEQLYQGGFEIITSLDYGLQNQADCASQIQKTRLHVNPGQDTSIQDPACEAANFLQATSEIEDPSTQDLDIEVVILNPESGQILAMVGNNQDELLSSNLEAHPVGTIASPWLYLTAFTQGMSPASILWDIPITYTNDSSDGARQVNESDLSTYHGPVSVRAAITNDYYGAAAGLYQQLGAENVWLVENQFGIQTPGIISNTQATIDDFYSQKATLLEITRAYGVLANQGFMAGQPKKANLQAQSQPRLTPTTLLSVSGYDGKTWLEWTKPETIPVVSTQLAFLTTKALTDDEVSQPNLAQESLSEIGRPVAVKTGRGTNDGNTWAVGFTPQIVVGVWVGDSQPGYSINPEPASDLWQAIIKYSTKELPIEDFSEPPGISHVLVCDPSGMLASPLCPSVKEEIFLSGTEPTHVDDLYQKYWVNRETGLLATIFTPAMLVDQKVFISIPAQALEWAKQAGFPMPPENYDTYPPPPPSEDAIITAPGFNTFIGGEVSFYGSAGGDNFSFYRLQVGQGVYPQEWMQLGKDIEQPVQNGLLGSWDTTGLQGEYLVELLVVKQDRQIEQAYLYLLVDNTAPSIKILAPENDGLFQIDQENTIILQASADDDFGLKQVEFVIDDQQIATLYESPYVVLWPAQLGQHELKITAYDMAGNCREEKLTFLVTQ